jgi:hypothetical protein
MNLCAVSVAVLSLNILINKETLGCTRMLPVLYAGHSPRLTASCEGEAKRVRLFSNSAHAAQIYMHWMLAAVHREEDRIGASRSQRNEF